MDHSGCFEVENNQNEKQQVESSMPSRIKLFFKSRILQYPSLNQFTG